MIVNKVSILVMQIGNLTPFENNNSGTLGRSDFTASKIHPQFQIFIKLTSEKDETDYLEKELSALSVDEEKFGKYSSEISPHSHASLLLRMGFF